MSRATVNLVAVAALAALWLGVLLAYVIAPPRLEVRTTELPHIADACQDPRSAAYGLCD